MENKNPRWKVPEHLEEGVAKEHEKNTEARNLAMANLLGDLKDALKVGKAMYVRSGELPEADLPKLAYLAEKGTRVGEYYFSPINEGNLDIIYKFITSTVRAVNKSLPESSPVELMVEKHDDTQKIRVYVKHTA